jgi:hypothetical protein
LLTFLSCLASNQDPPISTFWAGVIGMKQHTQLQIYSYCDLTSIWHLSSSFWPPFHFFFWSLWVLHLVSLMFKYQLFMVTCLQETETRSMSITLY